LNGVATDLLSIREPNITHVKLIQYENQNKILIAICKLIIKDTTNTAGGAATTTTLSSSSTGLISTSTTSLNNLSNSSTSSSSNLNSINNNNNTSNGSQVSPSSQQQQQQQQTAQTQHQISIVNLMNGECLHEILFNDIDTKKYVNNTRKPQSLHDENQNWIIAHFLAHQEPIYALEFNGNGRLLVSADCLGQYFNVFQINANSFKCTRTVVKHLYSLYRGDTASKVRNISFSSDSRWLAIGTKRGTTHIFPLNSYGGPVNARTHSKPYVVNRTTKHQRTAGIMDAEYDFYSASSSANSCYAKMPLLNNSSLLNINHHNSSASNVVAGAAAASSFSSADPQHQQYQMQQMLQQQYDNSSFSSPILINNNRN